MRKKNIILFFILSLLVVFYIFSFVFRKNSLAEKTTALLNPRYENDVQEVIIKNFNETIYLTKDDKVWSGKVGNNFFPVESSRIQSFIKELSKIITINLEAKDRSKLFADNEYSIYFEICLKNEQRTKINFLDDSFSSEYRYIFINNQKELYRMQNHLDAFILSMSSHWCDPFIIAQNTQEGKIDAKNIMQITYSDNFQTKSLNSNSKNFLNAIDNLLPLRHGTLYFEEDHEMNEDGKEVENHFTNKNNKNEKLCTISFECGNTYKQTINVFPFSNEQFLLDFEMENFLLEKKYAYNYKTFLSTWTFAKIIEALGSID